MRRHHLYLLPATLAAVHLAVLAAPAPAQVPTPESLAAASARK